MGWRGSRDMYTSADNTLETTEFFPYNPLTENNTPADSTLWNAILMNTKICFACFHRDMTIHVSFLIEFFYLMLIHFVMYEVKEAAAYISLHY